jgi:hypothetical protein
MKFFKALLVVSAMTMTMPTLFGNVAYGGAKVIITIPETRFNPFERPSRKPNKGRPTPAIDCQVSQWRKWGLCDSECGGTSRRFRSIIRTPANGGKACPARSQNRQSRACIDPPICARYKK